MKELKHDIESYIITIRRKGQQTTAAQTVTATAPRMKPSVHEYEPSDLHDPQAVYESASGSQASSDAAAGTATEITAPLPGIIVALKVKVGDTVREGDELAVLEAMKMGNSIESPRSGTVRSLTVSPGDTVSEGTVLITID